MAEQKRGSLVIKEARIVEQGDTYKLIHTLIEHGKKIELFFEVEKQWGKYLCPELADGILYLCLPLALAYDYDIVSHIPVSEEFLHNIRTSLLTSLLDGDPTLKPVQIEAPISNLTFMGTAAGTGVSGGVDSLYTILEYSSEEYKNLRLTHLFIASASMDLEIGKNKTLAEWEAKFKPAFERFYGIARETELPLVKAFSNYYKYLVMDHRARIIHLAAHTYITMANVLSLKKLWGTYYFANSYPLPFFKIHEVLAHDSAYYDILNMQVLTIPGFTCINSGADRTRIDKTLALGDYSIAQKYLHPCFTKEKQNCSKPACSKCLRALLTMDLHDGLYKFAQVFDVEYYLAHRIQFFEELIKNNASPYFGELFDKLSEKYPHEMALASELRDTNKFMFRAQLFESSYAISLKYLEFDALDELLKLYLQEKEISSFITIGKSKLGDDLALRMGACALHSVYTKGANPSDYNLALVLSTIKKDIDRQKRIFHINGFKNIYTLDTFYDAISDFQKSHSSGAKDQNLGHSSADLLDSVIGN